MSTSSEKAKKLISKFSKESPFDEVIETLESASIDLVGLHQNLPSVISWSKDAQSKRLQFLKANRDVDLPFLCGESTIQDPAFLKGNIENFIGMTQVPTGLIGPLFINGTEAKGDFYVPMATSEGALVASYTRGAKATRLSGGITSVCLTEGVQRAPVFKFQNLPELGKFTQWFLETIPVFKEIAMANSRFAKLEDVKLNIEGNQLITIFEFTTGDASGQNMITICSEAICQYILEHSPINPQFWFIESNYSGDKKATANTFTTVRGKKVTAEAFITKEVVEKVLNSTPKKMAQYWQTSSVAAVQSGTLGIQGHYANGLAALFLACGQDVACVTEAYVGITRMEVTEESDLYISVTLPGMIVGTVGGGTRLPTQRECLSILGCVGQGKARKFAEICAATVLAGELSIAAALSSGDFSKSHKLFGRQKS